MKINVRVVFADSERLFTVPIGRGDKTFKWLGVTAAQRFALANPNGSLRRREEHHGDTDKSSYCPEEIILGSGEIPHPSSLLSDFLLDGDEVTINISNKQLLDHSSSIPKYSQWSSVAFTSSTFGKNNSNIHDNGGDDDDIDDDSSNHLIVRNDITKQVAIEADAKFMRLLLKCQMLNATCIADRIDILWSNEISKVMPNLSRDDTNDFKYIINNHWYCIKQLFNHFTDNNDTHMNEEQFVKFTIDTNIFALSVADKLSSRIYKRISNALPLSSSNVFGYGGLITALILCSQTMHNDTFDIESYHNSVKSSSNSDNHISKRISQYRNRSADGFEDIFTKNILPILEDLELPCYLKTVFASDINLHSLRRYHDDLINVFHKYSSMGYYTGHHGDAIELKFMCQMLFESGLQEQGAASKTINYLHHVQNSDIIHGKARTIYVNNNMNSESDPTADREIQQLIDESFNYPEFVETVSLAGFYKWKSKTRATVSMPSTPSARKGSSSASAAATSIEEDISGAPTYHSYLRAVQFALKSLSYETPQIVTKNTRKAQY